jgi:hypothetical protein
VFKIMDPAGLARLWGIQKNHLNMVSWAERKRVRCQEP